ncbi:MAG: S41 family peptidase [Cytophagales bacterium]|nr:S41 family peptidase [Cytophagales bacterium]
MKRGAKYVIILTVVATITLAFANPSNDRYFQIVKNLDIFATLFKEVNAYYVDEVNPNTLMKTGIEAMLSNLDPYTTYIGEDDIEDYLTVTTGEYGGIGAVVDKKDGVNTIVLPYEGYAAHRAGLKIGDQILKINDVDLADKPSDQISKLLKGQSSSGIKLTIKRYKQPETFEVELKREKITVNNVPFSGMVNEDIAYIRLTDFTTKAGAEVANALKELKSAGAKKVILDLRGNPGGLLEEAINVSNVFVPRGVEVVSTKGKLDAWTKTYRSLNNPIDTEIPVAVLTDNGSASASEIVAGVIQDYDRGVLIGRRTFGKGLVQQTRPLAYNSQLKVTTAKYYIPSGRCIQAIDYSHRNPDGSVGKLPDSLKVEFKTKSGRLVFDGGGLDPDISVDRTKYAPITYSLLRKDHIFNFVTEFVHGKLEDPFEAKVYRLTDEEYNGFVTWLKGKDYDYTTKVERTIDALVKTAKEEKYFDEIKSQIEELQNATLHNKEQDLMTFQSEIRTLIEQEIAGRYELQKGIIESTFEKDRDILAAVEVLNDEDKYQSLLSGN